MLSKTPLSPYLRLMRLHQPVGIWLAYWPCAFAVVLADTHRLRWEMLMLLLISAALGRGVGCVVNDMADREFDKHVERTRARPLANGELTMLQATAFLGLLCLLSGIALIFLLRFSATSDALAWFRLLFPMGALIVAYPFMKRITWWPQAFLGIVFNWGVLVAWFAVRGAMEIPALLLYIGCFFWTLGYDTIYGYQDKKDDERIGIKSTSRWLENHARKWIGGFYACATGFFAAACWTASLCVYVTSISILMLAGHFFWQIKALEPENSQKCLKIFKSNAWLGLVYAGIIAVGALLANL